MPFFVEGQDPLDAPLGTRCFGNMSLQAILGALRLELVVRAYDPPARRVIYSTNFGNRAPAKLDNAGLSVAVTRTGRPQPRHWQNSPAC